MTIFSSGIIEVYGIAVPAIYVGGDNVLVSLDKVVDIIDIILVN